MSGTRVEPDVENVGNLLEIVGVVFVAEEPLEVGGGDLDEGLEEVSLLGIVPHGMPESFEDLVTFPPVGKVVEVNPIEIVL